MEERINDKINEIENYLEELSGWVPKNLEEYETDLKTKSACERHFEKIVECITDLAIFIIRNKKFRIPNDDESTFMILAENKIISDVLSQKLIDAKGMRNFIIHRYGDVDDSKVFHSLKEEFFVDVEEFLNNIKKCLE